MQTLSLAMQYAPEEGKPLDTPFSLLEALKAHHRRGQVSLVAAASGGGKSAYATHFAVHGGTVPTLYFSADTDKFTLGTRVLAGVLEMPLGRTEELLRSGNELAYSALRDATSHIWFNWDAQPSLPYIQDEVTAYGYATGAWPHLIVIDNLINVDLDGAEANHTSYDGVMHWFQQLANITNSHVMVLHHVTGPFEDGLIPIPKSALLYKVAKRPRLVLTLYRADENLMGIRVVKNSSGKAAADASFGPDVAWMPERSWFKG